jgi:hypothetical protein
MFKLFFLTMFVLSNNTYAESGSVLLWNKLGSEEEITHSEVGPGIQLTSYRIADWEEAQFQPAQFEDGLFINHDTSEGWLDDGGNFFAVNLNDVAVTPERGTLAFWFTFKYDSSIHNHSLFFMVRNALTDHFPNSEIQTNVSIAAGWNGWDYGSYGKRFFFSIGRGSDSVHLFTPNYSAAPGGYLEFFDGSISHFAFVWDIDGIDETGDTVRLYVDGNIEASSQEAWSTTNGFDPYLYLGSAPNYNGWDHYYNAVKGITDNLVIWDYAKSDFSDRFIENPGSYIFNDFTMNSVALKFTNVESESSDSAKLHGTFVLGTDNDGIDPLVDDLEIALGGYRLTIPSGSFVTKKSDYVFRGVIDGAKVLTRITNSEPDTYVISVKIKDIALTNMTNPIPIHLRIGNDYGEQEQHLSGVLKASNKVKD